MPRRAKIRPDEPGREKVLVAGLELFGERGYHATSIAEIGERAEIAKSVLYHYFGSKAKLYEAIAEAQTTDLIQHVAAAVSRAIGEPPLRPGVDAYLRFLVERPAAWRLLLRDPPVDPALIEVHERLAQQRCQMLATLLTTPDRRARDGEQVELVSAAIRAFASWWYEHREVPRQEVVEAILDVARAGARRELSVTS